MQYPEMYLRLRVSSDEGDKVFTFLLELGYHQEAMCSCEFKMTISRDFASFQFLEYKQNQLGAFWSRFFDTVSRFHLPHTVTNLHWAPKVYFSFAGGSIHNHSLPRAVQFHCRCGTHQIHGKANPLTHRPTIRWNLSFAGMLGYLVPHQEIPDLVRCCSVFVIRL